MNALTCSSCRETLPEESFARNRSSRTGRQNQCRECHNAAQRAIYARPEIRAARLARQRERALRHREIVTAMKIARGCELCGLLTDEATFLEWDHLDPSTKWCVEKPVGEGTTKGAYNPSWSWARIERELAKCRVLCRPCHRLHTWDQRRAGIVGKGAA